MRLRNSAMIERGGGGGEAAASRQRRRPRIIAMVDANQGVDALVALKPSSLWVKPGIVRVGAEETTIFASTATLLRQLAHRQRAMPDLCAYISYFGYWNSYAVAIYTRYVCIS